MVHSGDEGPDVPEPDLDGAPLALCDPARLRALSDAGLATDSDPAMERFAERVRSRLGVPVALVSLVQQDQQVFPGMAGLPEPWASKRSTPLSHSFCQHVVVSARPLVIEDAREHPLVRDNLAVRDLGVVAYAGMPLTDEAGSVLGSLCAIDTAPHSWTPGQMEALQELSEAVTTELRLRLARVDAENERRRRDALQSDLHRAFAHSQTLLSASQAFMNTSTVADVRARIGELVQSDLGPTYVGIVLDDGGNRLQRLHDATFRPGIDVTEPWIEFDRDAAIPSATAIREQRVVHHPDRDSFDREAGSAAQGLMRELDFRAVVAAPLPGPDGPIGAVVLAWDAPRAVETTDLLTINSIVGYAARALDRAETLQHQKSVADGLQRAMLTTLPDVPGLQMAARYQAADAREHVGGDWYDAAPVPDPEHPGEVVLAVSVGDILGHALQATTLMGQVRSMLRQAAWDHPGTPPSSTLEAFELANTGLDVNATGTAVLTHLRKTVGGWSMRWSNAGHPPPILVGPDGATTLLTAHDSLFGFPGVQVGPRTDNEITIEPGSLLFLYSDGLVERRGSDIDAGTDRLVSLLEQIHTRAPHELVDLVMSTLGTGSADDVVVFGIRLLPE